MRGKQDKESLISDLQKILKHNILEYWAGNALDKEHGGFVGYIGPDEKPDPEACKGIVLNTRILWSFSAGSLFLNNQDYTSEQGIVEDQEQNQVFESINTDSDKLNTKPYFAFSDITGSPTWWNNSYKYVKQVTISANTALSTNYTVQLYLNTSTLISASKMRSDCADLRVTYYNSTSSSWIELDRYIISNNTVRTAIHFRLQKNIEASNSDSNYALYYGITSGSPGNPPEDTSKIYLDYDDFASGNLNGYTTPGGSWSIITDSTKPGTNDYVARSSSTASTRPTGQ